MLVESYSNMKDSKSLRRDLRTVLNGLNGWNIYSSKGSKESTHRSSDGVSKILFPWNEITVPWIESVISLIILILCVHMRVEFTRKEISDNTVIFMHLTVIFTLLHFSFCYCGMDVYSFLCHPSLSSHIWFFSKLVQAKHITSKNSYFINDTYKYSTV